MFVLEKYELKLFILLFLCFPDASSHGQSKWNCVRNGGRKSL